MRKRKSIRRMGKYMMVRCCLKMPVKVVTMPLMRMRKSRMATLKTKKTR